MMYASDEHGGPKAKKSIKVELVPSSMSPSTKADLKMQKKLTAVVAKNALKKKDIKKGKKDKDTAKVEGLGSGEKVQSSHVQYIAFISCFYSSILQRPYPHSSSPTFTASLLSTYPSIFLLFFILFDLSTFCALIDLISLLTLKHAAPAV